MATRIVEWKKPYTWWEAIEITKDKVINLRLRDENNLIIYDEWDDEIYVDLQLEDGIEPTDAFPVWVTTGRVLVADDWDKTWTLISAKTTSGDNIQLLYADDGTLWIDNWTWTFKQVYLSTEIATILADYATKDYVDAHDTVISSSEPEEPYEWMLWYNTTNDKLKVYNWTSWQDIGSWWGGWWWAEIEYVTQAEYDALPSSKLTDDKHYFIYSTSGGWGWWLPWANTIAYYPFTSTDTIQDKSWNWNNLTNSWATFQTFNGVDCMFCDGTTKSVSWNITWIPQWANVRTFNFWCYNNQATPLTLEMYFTYWEEDTNKMVMPYCDSDDGVTQYGVGWTFWTALRSQWFNLCLVYDWSKFLEYINWSYVWDWTYTINTTWTLFKIYWRSWWSDWSKYYSNFIIEDKARTAQEVADYFDQTKADYWIGGWRTPSNPLCRYKFDGDYTDATGTYNAASWTSTFQTLTSWIKALETDGTNIVVLPSWITATSLTTWTIACWVKPLANGYFVWVNNLSYYYDMSMFMSTAGRCYAEWWWGSSLHSSATIDKTDASLSNDWRLFILKSDGTTVYMNINWQAFDNITPNNTEIFWGWDSFGVWGRSSNGQPCATLMSNLVISNTYWDDTTCLDMYNQTKANYWIS